MTKMKKIFLILFILLASMAHGSEWFDKNRNLEIVFSEKVWEYVKKADYYDSRGNQAIADSYLKLARRKMEQSRPFDPSNWPKGWPQSGESMKMLKYASPEAYLNRIIGDYALFHKRKKEALMYYNIYVERSIIPDTGYMMKIAGLYESENRWRDAKILYEEISKLIEAGNFRGTSFSPAYLQNMIKKTDLRLAKPNILTLDILFRNIQDFIKSDMQKMLADEIKNMNSFYSIDRSVFNKAMSEMGITQDDFKHDDELSNIGKMLNADYILRPVLTRIDDYYIFQVDIFNPHKSLWFESYEYKTESYEYLQNFVKRFSFQFQDRDIPDNLYIPENRLLWNYETDSFITDFGFSAGSRNIIAGTENGTIYVLNSTGVLLRQFAVPEKIIKVAISPCGRYFAWISLNGILYFGDIKGGIRWRQEVRNYARGIDIADEGRFLVISVNDGIVFKDRNGETFWDMKLPEWVSCVKISDNSRRVFVGMDGGQYWSISDEGNVLWKKNLNNKVANIQVSRNNENCAVTEAGRTFLYDGEGNEIVNFEAGQNIEYSVFNPEIMKLIAGKKGDYFYVLSQDRKKLWRYDLSGKTSFVATLDDGTFLTSVEGKNVFSFRIIWL